MISLLSLSSFKLIRMTTKRNYTKLEFSPEEEVQIIDFVKQNPLLYDPKNVNYKNKAMRDKTWNDLGNILEKSGFYRYSHFNRQVKLN